MDYSQYYEQEFEGDILVTLDYQDPEPSLYQQSRGQHRPQRINREFSVRGHPKQRQTRNPAFNQRSGRRLHNEYDNSGPEEYDEYRDDGVYDGMDSRVSIQDERSVSNRSLGMRQGYDRRHSSRSKGMSGSSRQGSNRSSSASVARKKGKSNKMDLSGPDSDSSFELFASLLIQHIEPKVNGSEYTLNEGDMAYLEAIIPEALRLPFVEAVGVRERNLPMNSGSDETELEAATRKCAELGFGYRAEQNFLLGGGQKTADGWTIIQLIGEGSQSEVENEENFRGIKTKMTEEDALAQVEAAFNNRDREMASKKASERKSFQQKEAKEQAIIQAEEIRKKELVDKDASVRENGKSRKSVKALAGDKDIAPELGQDMDWLKNSGLSVEQMNVISIAMGAHDTPNATNHDEKRPTTAITEKRQPDSEKTDRRSDTSSSLKSAAMEGSEGASSQESMESSSRTSAITSSQRPKTSSSRKSMPSNNRQKSSRKSMSTQRKNSESTIDDGVLLNKEALLADVIDEEASMHEPVFDMTMKKLEEAQQKAKANSRRKKKKRSATKSIVSAAISVNTDLSNLDMTVAAFEHEWRDGLFDIFANGFFHPFLFLSFWAPILALGQVMTRLKLNWIGVPSTEAGTRDIFRKVGTLVGCWIATNILAVSSFVFSSFIVSGLVEFVLFLAVMTNLLFYGFCVFVTGNTRQYLREIYNIQDTPHSDYLLAAIYMPFTIAQMGRHTADYNSLQARLCTASGLAEGADYSFIANVGTFNSFGSYKSFNDDATSVTGSVASTYAGSVASYY